MREFLITFIFLQHSSLKLESVSQCVNQNTTKTNKKKLYLKMSGKGLYLVNDISELTRS